jgi:radical SAM superfamily enzyme YgiQ (UPF0313 family)
LAPDFTSCYQDQTNSSFHFVERLLSSEQLFRYIADRRENTFLDFFLQSDILAEIENQKIEIVGISIIAPSQVIGAFTLGWLIKKNFPGIHVNIGGQWVSLFREALKKRADFFHFFDSMIIFEGETALLNLLAALSEERNLSLVPNLIYHSDSRWVQSETNHKEDLNTLACPDFDGLPLKEYLGTEPDDRSSLTYQTARECYWNKCIYCVDLPLPKQGYRQRDMSLIIDDIKQLIQRYDMSHLMISNATVAPSQLKELSENILREKLDFSWWCFARLDSGFTKDVIKLAKSAGCHTIDFGLESGNQRVLDFINKGINLELAKKIIADCHDIGMKVDLQMMVGLPSEKITEAMDTVKFLIEHSPSINNATFNAYYVTPASCVYLNPLKYGIEYKKYPELPFKFFHDFSHITGEIPRKKANNLIALYWQLLQKKSKEIFSQEHSDSFKANYRLSEYQLSLDIGDDSVSLFFYSDKEKRKFFLLDRTEVKQYV